MTPVGCYTAVSTMARSCSPRAICEGVASGVSLRVGSQSPRREATPNQTRLGNESPRREATPHQTTPRQSSMPGENGSDHHGWAGDLCEGAQELWRSRDNPSEWNEALTRTSKHITEDAMDILLGPQQANPAGSAQDETSTPTRRRALPQADVISAHDEASTPTRRRALPRADVATARAVTPQASNLPEANDFIQSLHDTTRKQDEELRQLRKHLREVTVQMETLKLNQMSRGKGHCGGWQPESGETDHRRWWQERWDDDSYRRQTPSDQWAWGGQQVWYGASRPDPRSGSRSPRTRQ